MMGEGRREEEASLLNGYAYDIQRCWKKKMQKDMLRGLAFARGLAQCCVCCDEGFTLYRCEYGHGICVNCNTRMMDDKRCPLCRRERSKFPDPILPLMGRHLNLRLSCASCRKLFPPHTMEQHRAWCEGYKYECPFHPTCNCILTSEEMAAHCHCAHAVRVVTPTRVEGGGEVFPIVLVTGVTSSTVVVVGGVVVTVHVQREDYHLCPREALSLSMRGVYPSPHSKTLSCTVRQLRCEDCFHIYEGGEGGEYTEEFRYGKVPPILANREGLPVHTSYSPKIHPLCRAYDSAFGFNIVHTDFQSSHSLSTVISSRGISNESGERGETGLRVAILHLIFTQDSNNVVSSSFPL